jgi:hypothetical protein
MHCLLIVQILNIFSEYLLPEGDEALSEDAEAAIATILVKDITQRPSAKGLWKVKYNTGFS